MAKTEKILLIFLILAAVAVTGVLAKGGGPDNGMGLQVQNQSQVQDRLSDVQNPIRNQSQDQERVRDQIQVQQTGQVRLQNQTRAMNVTLLHQQLQEQIQEQEHAGRSPDQQRVFAHYSNVSAFVHLLLNESQNNALLGEGPGGIGPQVSDYARQFNNSLQVQLQAEERIGNRNGIVRFFSGGDAEAAGTLEQETIRNQGRIQAMTQLINQCQDCDGQVKEMLQEQLQNMEMEQTRLLQLAQQEKQDKGIFGWFQR
jgi:bacterioferritin-associated ferredoxin